MSNDPSHAGVADPAGSRPRHAPSPATTTTDLVIYKAATVRQHLRENLRLIQPGPLTEPVTYAFHRRWIAPDLIERGLGAGLRVVVALANRPYRDAIPVRDAELIAVHEEDELIYGFELRLGALLEPEIAEFSDAVSEVPSPGGVFIGPGPSRYLPRPARDPVAAWRTVADALRGHENYASSAFLRLDAIEVDEDRVAAADAPGLTLGSGQEPVVVVESRNDHLDPAERSRMHLIGDAAAWSIALDEPLAPEGLVRFPIRVEPEDRPRLRFRLGVRPRWADSAVLDIDLAVAAEGEAAVVPVSSPPPDEAPHEGVETPPQEPAETTPVIVAPPPVDLEAAALRPQDAHRLLEALRREQLGPTLGIVEDHLLRWFPGDPRLEAELIRLLFDAGREADAAQRIADLPPAAREQVDPWLRFRGAVARGDSGAAVSALEEVGDFSDEHLDLLVAGLERMSPDALGRVLARLADKLLGEKTLSDVLLRLDPAEMDPRLAAQVAELTEMTLSPAEALHVLQRRLALGFDLDLARRAATLAAGMDGRQPLGEWVGDLIEVEIRQGDSDQAVGHLNALLGDLSYDQKVRLVTHAAAHLRPLSAVVTTMQSVARDALGRADFVTVAALVAILAKAGSGDMAQVLALELQGAMEQTETIRRYLDLLYEERRKRAADALAGHTLILVGGPGEQREHVVSLKGTFRLDAVNWITCEHDTLPPLDKVKSAQPESHLVVLLTDHMGHATSDNVMAICARSGVRVVRCPSRGLDTIERAIVDLVAPAPA